ncbi:unnamed protein product [Durusdinium trenchii]|uniref:Uncharacterized protein n=1 Tax=Durusdinium trenchii TaxID=1381693 RepID=A0ABP0K0K1_9DINO
MTGLLSGLLMFSRASGAWGVTCNSGSSTNYTGSDCGTMSGSEAFTAVQCSGNCYTESMKQGITPNGVCDVIFVTAGCVQNGSKDCATLQATYNAMDPSAGNYGFACEECSSDSCNPTTPLSTTISATASDAQPLSMAVIPSFCLFHLARAFNL